MNTTQRVAMVTAAAGGIGRATVRHLLAAGDQVIAVDVDEAALHALTNEIGSASLHPMVADLTVEDEVDRVFAEVGQRGPLHTLVNGVGSKCDGALRDLSFDKWRRMFDLNLTSVFLCTRAALPLLEATTGDRVVINISSTLAAVADPSTLAYSAFKAGLEQWTRVLALELAPTGVRAVAVAPGPVLGTAVDAAYDSPEYARLNPMGRFASTDEIAGVIAFLASPTAAYITGTVLRVDGGDRALGAGWGPLQRLLSNDSAPSKH